MTGAPAGGLRALARSARRAAAGRLRVPRRLLVQPARRRRRRRRPVHGAGRVPRRPRPGAAVRRPGRRRAGRPGREDRAAGRTGRRVVTLTVNGDVDLPANAVAKIQQSSLLGEKFVELAAPGNEKPRGRARATTRASRSSGPTATSRSRSSSARCRWCSTAAGWRSCRRSTGSSARRCEGREADVRSTLDRARHLHRRPRRAEGGDQPGAGQRERARRHAGRRAPPRSTPRWTRIGPGLDVINQQRDLLVVDAAEPGPARRRRHADHQPVRGRHRRPTCSCCSRS